MLTLNENPFHTFKNLAKLLYVFRLSEGKYVNYFSAIWDSQLYFLVTTWLGLLFTNKTNMYKFIIKYILILFDRCILFKVFCSTWLVVLIIIPTSSSETPNLDAYSEVINSYFLILLAATTLETFGALEIGGEGDHWKKSMSIV